MSRRKDSPNNQGRRGLRAGELSSEDAALWQFVTKDVVPKRGKARVRAPVDAGAVEAPRVPVRESSDVRDDGAKPIQRTDRPGRSEAKRGPVAPTGVPASSRPKPGLVPAPIEIERRKVRRIAKGVEDIDARLDLHGLTQDEAHGALVAFIRQCQAQGMKTVLVITGKGRAGNGPELRGRGVLRQNVPRWINEPGLAGLVIGYSAASIRHGGDGALYVRLRRRR